ncbi:MAG TPA: hypothetical protein VNN17_00245 [Terriglobia bacterium]|nr:hypothetical protein [Terriglobia bacterium]
MKDAYRPRRSKRVPGVVRLLLTVLGPTGAEIAKEIVSTIELSRHGARVRGRRSLRQNAEGTVTQLSSGRQARFRVAWQKQTSGHPGFLDTGLEILSEFDYWGKSFDESKPEYSDSPGAAEAATAQELIAELKRNADGPDGGRSLELLWCALVEHLEAKKVLSRDELIRAVRSIAEQSKARGEAKTTL